MIKRKTRVILLENANSEYKRLNEIVGKQIKDGRKNSDEMQLLRSIKQKFELIKLNPFYGDNIPKRIILQSNYDVKNLWRVELSKFWRMLYTIKGDQVEVICFVLDIVDHSAYNKKLKYKKK
jgi:hypothetical protein